MEYRVNLAGSLPDAERLSSLLAAEDPAAIGELDRAASVWRVNTMLSTRDLLGLLDRSGCAVAPAQVILLPSVCCGGCSG